MRGKRALIYVSCFCFCFYILPLLDHAWDIVEESFLLFVFSVKEGHNTTTPRMCRLTSPTPYTRFFLGSGRGYVALICPVFKDEARGWY